MLGEFSPMHRPPFGGEYYVFRDPIHNLIEIEDSANGVYIRKLLQTRELQRLRHIRQNGFSFLVYASIETSRFPHALGSFHIAQRIANSLIERQPHSQEGFPQCLQLTKRDTLAFAVAALLHDIGHGPLSHVWEECWAEPRGISHFHEKMGFSIVTDEATSIGKLLAASGTHKEFQNLGPDVLRFLSSTHHLDYLSSLLEGNLDVDRLDFIARDTQSAGVTYGFHDLEWIIRSLRFARLPARYFGGSRPRWVIAIDGRKGLSTLIQFLHARENMYRLVYLHKTTRAATAMLRLLFKRARALAKKKTLSCHSDALKRALSSSSEMSSGLLVQLDDSDIWSTIKYWANGGSEDRVLQDLSTWILSRDLFKVFLLSEDVYKRLNQLDSPSSGHTLRAIVQMRLGCSAEEATYYYALDKASVDAIGSKPDKAWRDAWIMESGSLGFEFRTLREYWKKEVRTSVTTTQYLLVVHQKIVPDLADMVARLSFPGHSAREMKTVPTPPAQYRIVAPLGKQGAWKEVYAGTNITPGSEPEKVIALKRYISADPADKAVERDVQAINLLLSGSHPNLSTPRLLKNEGGETWIAEPLWTASLEDLIKRDGPRRDIWEIIDISEQLFAGLAQLHSKNLRHTDIKPDNCGIITADVSGMKYVLGDFGCLSSRSEVMPIDPRLLGTLRTRAPEVLRDRRISLSSDVWSMGATIFALCVGEYPFMPFDAPHHDSADRTTREEEMRSKINELVTQHRERVAASLPPIIATILERCFRDDGNRESAERVRAAFHEVRSDLKNREDGYRTAWERSEDIMQRFEGLPGPPAGEDLRKEVREEIESLTLMFKDFVPPDTRSGMMRLVSTPGG